MKNKPASDSFTARRAKLLLERKKHNEKNIFPPSNIELALELFISFGCRGVDQATAAKLYGETYLHSMVSHLTNSYTIKFTHSHEEHENQKLQPVNKFTRYSFASKNDEQIAKRVLIVLQAQRGLLPRKVNK